MRSTSCVAPPAELAEVDELFPDPHARIEAALLGHVSPFTTVQRHASGRSLGEQLTRLGIAVEACPRTAAHPVALFIGAMVVVWLAATLFDAGRIHVAS